MTGAGSGNTGSRGGAGTGAGGAGSGSIGNQPNQNDPWALSQQGYDRTKFYTRATDGQGHGAVMHCKISPALMHEIQALVQSAQITELRTYADVVRDALIHRLHDYRDMISEGTIGHAIAVEMRQAELDKLRANREAWDQLINDANTTLHDLIAAGEYDEAWWVIEQNENFESMSPSFLDKMAQTLDKHRNDLLRLDARVDTDD